MRTLLLLALIAAFPAVAQTASPFGLRPVGPGRSSLGLMVGLPEFAVEYVHGLPPGDAPPGGDRDLFLRAQIRSPIASLAPLGTDLRVGGRAAYGTLFDAEAGVRDGFAAGLLRARIELALCTGPVWGKGLQGQPSKGLNFWTVQLRARPSLGIALGWFSVSAFVEGQGDL